MPNIKFKDLNTWGGVIKYFVPREKIQRRSWDLGAGILNLTSEMLMVVFTHLHLGKALSKGFGLK